MNWSAFPYLRIAFSLSLGIFTADYFKINSCSSICFIFFATIWLISENIRLPLKYQALIRSLLLLITTFLLGTQLLALKYESLNNNLILDNEKKEVIITGKISEELKSKMNQKFILKCQYLHKKEGIKPVTSDIIITFSRNDTVAGKYKSGDKIILKSKLKRVDPPSNPEAFNYKKYLLTKGILNTCFVKESKHFLVESGVHNRFQQSASNMADFTSNTLSKYIKDTTALGIAQALLIGQRLLLTEEIQTAYANTGAMHVLSVSGLHVAIFISIFIWLFDKPKVKNIPWRILKILSLLSIIWFYVILTGMSPSVIRAGTMVSMYIIGKNLFNNVNSYNLLSVAAILMLIYNPLYLFQASFQFSFISLLSILYFQPKIKKLWIPKGKILNFIWDLISVSIAAQILIFPFTVYFFHQFPLYFALSGLVAVPLVTFIIYIGTLMVVAEFLFNPINQFLAIILEGIIVFLNKMILFISNLPYSIISNIWMSDFELFLLVVAIIITMFWIEKRSLITLYLPLIIFSFLISNLALSKIEASNQNKIYIYNTYGGFIVDIFEGRLNRKISSEHLAKSTESFATSNNRIKHRIVKEEKYLNNIYKNGKEIFYFYTDQKDLKKLKERLNTNILFISDTNKNTPENVLSLINPELVILDNNVKPWIRKKWLNLQQNHQLKIHDIKSSGAFSYSF